MYEKLLSIMVCPVCRGDLHVDRADSDGSTIESGVLECSGCFTGYPVEQGIPRFADLAHIRAQPTAESANAHRPDNVAILPAADTQFRVEGARALLTAPVRRDPPCERVYSSPMFKKWNSLVKERVKYYTENRSLAGLMAGWSYRSIRRFDARGKDEWLLDIGCGEGRQAALLKNRSTYIGLDRNMERLTALKKQHPEATAIYADATTLPFKSKSLRCVFSCNAFEHIWYLKDAVLELHRCAMADIEMRIVIPTEGGLWNLGRRFLSKPFFTRRHPDLDFDFISRVEHCNEACQVIRSFEMLFHVENTFRPTRLPSVLVNALVELKCQKRQEILN